MSRAGENNGSIDPATGRAASTSFSLQMFERFVASPRRCPRSSPSRRSRRSTCSSTACPDVTASASWSPGNYYEALGVPAAIGRTLQRRDDRPARSTPVAVISYRYWERRFAGDAPTLLARSFMSIASPTTIVGVDARRASTARCRRANRRTCTVPIAHYLRFQPDRASRAQPWYWWVRIMGRLNAGGDPRRSRASLEPIFQQAAREGWLAGRRHGKPTDRAMPGAADARGRSGRPGRERSRRQYAVAAHPHGPGRPRARSPRAPTSRTCCWRAALPGGARSRCGSRSAPAVAVSCGS